MQTKISTLFYIKRTKTNNQGQVPIYLRVTVDGDRFEMSSTKFVEPSKWSNHNSKVKGNSEEARLINSYLENLKIKVFVAEKSLIACDISINLNSLKNEILGVREKRRMLIPIFEDHNKKVKELIGKEYADGTSVRYSTTLKHTKDFLLWKYSMSDIDIKQINHSFITEFEFYLRTQRSCANNTAVKYIKNFKKVVRICLANGWIDKDPFVNYKSKLIEVERDYLLQEELNSIYKKQFSTIRLNQVKDIYIFSCFTGLAYIDVKQLKKENVSIGIDGNKWIFTHRQKTDTASKIPLLPIAEEIIEKYANHPQCLNEGKLLPILSNQRMNSYLKEVADICGINKDLTFHTARHTFATTVTLSNGVPIESVSKMLGHTNIKTTQHYAKILDKKVSQDMEQLKSILALKTIQSNATNRKLESS
jgi:site-specific recombinase XerD